MHHHYLINLSILCKKFNNLSKFIIIENIKNAEKN
ncbi:hypothetical protein [Buchnera aphidicola]